MWVFLRTFAKARIFWRNGNSLLIYRDLSRKKVRFRCLKKLPKTEMFWGFSRIWLIIDELAQKFTCTYVGTTHGGFSVMKSLGESRSIFYICSYLGTTHGGFPVVKSLGESLENTFCGEISRLELRNLMTRPELFIMKSDFSATVGRPEAEFLDVIGTKKS